MTDPTFESFLSSQLRQYAEAGVRPIDRRAIATATIATGRGSGWARWRLAPRTGEWGVAGLRSVRYAAVLLLTLLATPVVYSWLDDVVHSRAFAHIRSSLWRTEC